LPCDGFFISVVSFQNLFQPQPQPSVEFEYKVVAVIEALLLDKDSSQFSQYLFLVLSKGRT